MKQNWSFTMVEYVVIKSKRRIWRFSYRNHNFIKVEHHFYNSFTPFLIYCCCCDVAGFLNSLSFFLKKRMISVYAILYQSLFSNERFIFDEMLQGNASKIGHTFGKWKPMDFFSFSINIISTFFSSIHCPVISKVRQIV